MRFTKRVVAQGHVTVPSDLRSVLDIAPGDLVEFEVVGIVRRKNAPSQVPSPSRISEPIA